ncbi:MAG: Sec-independent protein translocase protein TatB [Gallionella sp.]
MFDFSVLELMVIMVVALMIIGPERLPKVARTMGQYWGKAQRYVNGVKADIERDMAVEEFRQLQQKVQEEASDLEKSVNQASQSLDNQVQQLNEGVARSLPIDQPVKADQPSAADTPPASMPDTTQNTTPDKHK